MIIIDDLKKVKNMEIDSEKLMRSITIRYKIDERPLKWSVDRISKWQVVDDIQLIILNDLMCLKAHKNQKSGLSIEPNKWKKPNLCV